MKKYLKSTVLLIATLLSISACQPNGPAPVVIPTPIKPEIPEDLDYNNIAFTSDDISQQSFGGIGVEWGVYEDTDKIIEGGWDRIIKHMDHLGASRIRLMVSYDWFCQKFDDKGTKTHNDDTWIYNFTNKYAKNMMDILD